MDGLLSSDVFREFRGEVEVGGLGGVYLLHLLVFIRDAPHRGTDRWRSSVEAQLTALGNISSEKHLGWLLIANC